AEYFETQTGLQRERLEAAQAKLSDFQQKYGIVANDDRLDFETQRLSEISTRLTQAQNQTSQLKAKEKVGRSETLEDVTSNSLINQLRFEVARAESKLKELSGNYGVNHPLHQRASAELAELRQRLGAETARITSSVVTANRVSESNTAELQAAFENQKHKVLELRKHRDEISVLMREVDAAQKAFDAVTQRLTQSQLESQSIQSNVSILTRAVEPITHTKPKVLLNVVLAAFLGGLLGIVSALVLELSQRRIRSAEDLAMTVDLPVLAELAPASPAAERGGWRYFRQRSSGKTATPPSGSKS
ncbi:MAG: chain length determinant protein EpsF, partial [Azonexus sp.]|nr:chain length determinant protein EpsF [Azonexus sp.]